MFSLFLSSSLEFGKGPPPEPGAPPSITNDILAMISPEKESVTLQKVYTFFENNHGTYSIYVVLSLLLQKYAFKLSLLILRR